MIIIIMGVLKELLNFLTVFFKMGVIKLHFKALSLSSRNTINWLYSKISLIFVYDGSEEANCAVFNKTVSQTGTMSMPKICLNVSELLFYKCFASF